MRAVESDRTLVLPGWVRAFQTLRVATLFVDSFLFDSVPFVVGHVRQKRCVSMTVRERFHSKACQFLVRICEHSTVQMFHAFVRCNFNCQHLECMSNSCVIFEEGHQSF